MYLVYSYSMLDPEDGEIVTRFRTLEEARAFVREEEADGEVVALIYKLVENQ